MKIEVIFFFYLIAINAVSGIAFLHDKRAAKKSRHRTPERTLHILEMMGGVFANLLLMYGLHHKNRKFRYYVVTWMIMMGWLVILIYNIQLPI